MYERQSPKRSSFGPDKRLSQSSEFQQVLKVAKPVYRAGPLRISFMPSIHGHARLGVVVPKRIVKRSVQRNAIKRVIREWFRCNAGGVGSLDVVVSLRFVLPNQGDALAVAIRSSLCKWKSDLRTADAEK